MSDRDIEQTADQADLTTVTVYGTAHGDLSTIAADEEEKD